MTGAPHRHRLVKAGVIAPPPAPIPADEDAAAAFTFRDFLRETPSRRKGVPLPDLFATPEAYRAWQVRWLPYSAGLADGPTTPEQYREHLPRLREMKRAPAVSPVSPAADPEAGGR